MRRLGGMESSSSFISPASSFVFTVLLFLLLAGILKKTSGKKTPAAPLPPSPPGLPLIGNLHQLGPLQHRSLHSLAGKHGPLMLLRLGHQPPTLVVSSAEMAKEVMKTHDRTFASRPSLKVARLLFPDTFDLGFAPYSEHWRQLRKLTTVHFLCAKKVQSYRSLREEETAVIVERIRLAASSGRPVDLSQVLNSFTEDVITRIVAGRKFRESGRDKLFSKLTAGVNAAFTVFFFEDFFPSLSWVDDLLGSSARVKRVAEAWDVALEEVMNEHADRLGVDGEDDGGEEKDFVDVLLSLLTKPDRVDVAFSREDLKALMIDMFSAGIETSYTTLIWAMAELVRNPQVLKKLQDEARAVAKHDTKAIIMIKDEKDLERMVYMRAVLKEVFRLHPPAPLLLPHESMDDCKIQGFHIPKKTRVIINAWAIGRDPKHWKDPEEFKPERFLTDKLVNFNGNDFELIPFGAGRRICPGLHLGISNIEIVLANLICCFDWELPDGLTAQDFDMTEAPGLTIGRKNPLHLVAKEWDESTGCTHADN